MNRIVTDRLSRLLRFVFVVAVALALLISGVYAVADSAAARLATDSESNPSYWNTYAVPTSMMTYSANRGYFPQPEELAKAFDRNMSTMWKSNFVHNGTYTLDGVKNTGWHNTVDVVFSESVTIDRVVYAAANEADGKGYPTQLIIHYDSDAEGEYDGSVTYNTSTTTNVMCFPLGGEKTVKRVQLEWADVNRAHYWNATAREIVFLQPENADIENLFADFTRTSLSEGYTQEKLDLLRASLESNINYEAQFKPLLDRAQGILDGTVSFNARNFYSTNPADGGNQLYQYGARRSYTQNTLRISWFGIDKQSLGLAGKAGETITVYVEADPGANLPNMCFTQYWGSWRGWQGEFKLQRGVNVLTVPAYCLSYCTYPAQQMGGGPFYIENPYNSSTQGGNVKVYIEGGYEFPLYRLGGDEAQFKRELTEYAANFSSEGSTTSAFYFKDGVGFNVAEMESDHVLVTVQATNTYSVLVGGNKSAKTSMTNWDTVIEKLMEYDGIPTSSDSKYAKYWNDCNEHLGINVRLGQPVGAAYGAYEQVGVFTDGWIGSAIYCDGRLGWGMIHEVGHTMDMNDRVVSECSNNMYSKYFESVEFSDGTRGNFAKDLAYLTNDRTDFTASSYFDQDRLNYLVWFRLESYHPGFWGEIANLYRYDCAGAAGLNSTEKHIYLASRVLGIDLRYYYERFGYHQATGDAQFTIATQSAALNTAMQKLLDSGEITDTLQPKFWYFDTQQYRLNSTGQLSDNGIYTAQSTAPSIKSIEKTSSGYSILLTGASSNTNHLGYEVLEGSDETGWSVVGFTYGGAITDTTDYSDTALYGEDYVPQYKVVCVDRKLNSTPASEPVKPTASGDRVCRNESTGTTYSRLSDAVNEAAAGDTITLLTDLTETGIVISKNLTVTGGESSPVLSKGSSGILIKVNGNAVVTLSNIVLDGNGFEQSGTLVLCESGEVKLTNAELRNNIIAYGSDSYGGALRSTGGRLTLVNTDIHNCSARYGGAISLSKAGGRITLKGCDIYSNYASENGGALSITGCVDTITDTLIRDNTAVTAGGGIHVYSGGIVYSNYNGTNTSVVISGNSARDGGGIWQDGTTKLWNTTVTGNNATANGGGLYSNATGTYRMFFSYGCEFSNNTAVHTGTQVYSKCASNSGPVLQDTLITGKCAAGKALVHQESGTAGVPSLTGTTVCKTVHSQSPVLTPQVSATCTDNGKLAFYTCPVCGFVSSDSEGQTSVTDAELIISPLNHLFDDTYCSDESGHWHSCRRDNCTAVTAKEPHVTDTSALCTVCGYDTHVHALTPIAAIPADCVHTGNIAYYTCTCGAWFYDEAGAQQIENHDSVITSALGHSYSTEWSRGSNAGHHHECERCGSYEQVFAHTFDDGTDPTCTVCGFTQLHTHSLNLVEARSAGCTEAGISEHYVCGICGTWFATADSNGSTDNINEITDHSAYISSALGHDFTGDWHSDLEGHWHKCSRCETVETKGGHNCAGTDCSCTICGHEHVVALTYVAERASTCIEKGCVAHYRCACGDLFADSTGATALTEAQVYKSLAQHTWKTGYSADSTGHWKVCGVCGNEDEKHDHSVAAGQHQCSTCEYWLSHELEPVEGREASCSQSGLTAHYRCKGCGSLFRDAEAAQAVTAEELVIEPLPHQFGDWTAASDGIHHSHTCAKCTFCEKEEHTEDPSAHSCTVCLTSFGVHVDGTPADCTHEGTAEHYECGHCGELYIINTEGAQETVLAEQLVLEALGHLHNNTWVSDENGHHLTCTRCNESEDAEPHRNDGTGHCIACGHTITKLTNTITLEPAPEGGRLSLFYGETPIIPEATAEYGEPEMTIKRGSAVVSDFSGAGVYTVTWTVPEGETYSAASASIEVTVNKAKNSVSLSTADSEAAFTLANQVELPSADSDYGEIVRTITKDCVPVESIDAVGTYVVTWTVAEGDNYLGAEASFRVIVTGQTSGHVCEADVRINFSGLTSGEYRLLLNDVDTGRYSFEKVSGGYTVRNAETGKYVCLDNGEIVYRDTNPTVWEESDSSLSATVTETTRWWLFKWRYSTKTVRYYLNSDSKGTLNASKTACSTGFLSHYAADSHSLTYTDNGNGTHTAHCTVCEYSFTDFCEYDESGHCSACGGFDASRARVTGVTVNVTKSTVKGGLKIQNRKLVYVKAYTQYTAQITPTAEGTTVASVEYSTNGTGYSSGSSFSSTSAISRLWIRVTDGNGATTVWYYDGSTVKQLS